MIYGCDVILTLKSFLYAGGDVMNRYDLDMSFIKKIFYWQVTSNRCVDAQNR